MLFTRQVTNPEAPTTMTDPIARRPRLTIETLDDRVVPSSLAVSDVTVREGPSPTGILDPVGAAAVGLNGVRGMTFDTRPSDAHYGDLFVTGYLSHSVARFDWASQTYQPFVTPNSGGLTEARSIAFGPDGNVYVSDLALSVVFRYDGATGAPLPAPGQSGAVFIPADSRGLDCIAFGADGNLYVSTTNSNQILEYQGPAGLAPGAFIRVFVSLSDGSAASNLTFGPDGNLYGTVQLSGVPGPSQVNRYDGSTGAPIGTGVFIPNGSGGLLGARTILFDPQGINMYVVATMSPSGGPMGQVLRYQGPNGQNPGAYVEAYITGGQAGLSIPIGLARDAAGNVYVNDRDTANVTRFAPVSQASFTVTLDSASASPVSVTYATANGTAVAGTDFTQTSGTLTFPAGVTSETVTVPITTIAAGGPTKTFTLNLSSPVNATIADGQGVGSILNRQTKFFVADGGTPKTYQYGSGGTSEEITRQASGDTAPRGVATTAAGTTVWVVDANKNVYVYTNHGVLLGSWAAGGELRPSTQLSGIATNGTDLWLVDSFTDKVYKYAGAASRLSGSQNATSSFKLSNGDGNPQDIVTDGTSFWVVDGTALKVFKYTLSGSLLGSWAIDPADAHPTGITLNPANPSDLWIVDNGTLKVYQYTAAAGRTSGSQNASATFALNQYDTNPQGIADPPSAVDGVLTSPITTVPASVGLSASLIACDLVSRTQSLVPSTTTDAGRIVRPPVAPISAIDYVSTSSFRSTGRGFADRVHWTQTFPESTELDAFAPIDVSSIHPSVKHF
jgi:sugar lactone lactonase YvrE